MPARRARTRFYCMVRSAKGELKKRLEIDNLGDRIVGVETADKMTDPQIAAKARMHFADHGAAAIS